MKEKIVVEIVEWKIVPGADETSVLRAVQTACDNHISNEPGFIDWEIVKGDKGSYMEILHWDSMEHALQAADNAKSDPACLAFFKYLDKNTVKMRHLTRVWYEKSNR